MRKLFSLLFSLLLCNSVMADDVVKITISNDLGFARGEEMVEILKKAGFKEAGFLRLTFGICTMYYAEK